MAAIEVKMVDCRLRAKYSVAKREMKYTEVKTIRSPENRCFRWLTGPHKNEKLKFNYEQLSMNSEACLTSIVPSI